jgi:hypothetical protein
MSPRCAFRMTDGSRSSIRLEGNGRLRRGATWGLYARRPGGFRRGARGRAESTRAPRTPTGRISTGRGEESVRRPILLSAAWKSTGVRANRGGEEARRPRPPRRAAVPRAACHQVKSAEGIADVGPGFAFIDIETPRHIPLKSIETGRSLKPHFESDLSLHPRSPTTISPSRRPADQRAGAAGETREHLASPRERTHAAATGKSLRRRALDAVRSPMRPSFRDPMSVKFAGSPSESRFVHSSRLSRVARAPMHREAPPADRAFPTGTPSAPRRAGFIGAAAAWPPPATVPPTAGRTPGEPRERLRGESGAPTPLEVHLSC